jgi:hypothetical protein
MPELPPHTVTIWTACIEWSDESGGSPVVFVGDTELDALRPALVDCWADLEAETKALLPDPAPIDSVEELIAWRDTLWEAAGPYVATCEHVGIPITVATS